MSNKKLREKVIEELMNSDYGSDPNHDVYGYIIDDIPGLGNGRVGSMFLQMLNELDWDEIKAEVKRMKLEIV